MSWVEPVGYLRLLRGIPLEPGYENTLYFITATEQYNYFFNHPGISFDKLSYTRYNRGIIRVARNIRECYDINYLMYCNDTGGPPSGNRKWFYCFVTEVNYISEGTTEIVFQPDVLQTWMFNYTLGKCFVERQHTETDEIGEWIEDEGLDPGPYIYEEYEKLPEFDNWSVVVAANFEIEWVEVEGAYEIQTNMGGDIYAGLYSAINYHVFPIISTDAYGNVTYDTDQLSKLNQLFKQMHTAVGDYTDQIVAVFMIPTAFATPAALSSREAYHRTINFYKKIPLIDQSQRWTYYDDNGQLTHPANNKIYTYPYTACLVTNQQNYSSVFPYEFLNPGSSVCTFRLEGLVSPVTECQLIPLLYKGVNQNYLEKIPLSGFPLCSYTTDSFEAWLAQATLGTVRAGLNLYGSIQQANVTKTSGMMSTINPIASDGPFSSGPYDVPGIPSGDKNSVYKHIADKQSRNRGRAFMNMAKTNELTAVFDSLMDVGKSMIANFPFSGNQSSGLGVATKSFGFRFYNARLTDNYAKRIDSFFSKFGYKLSRNMVPNRYARVRWTYLKTSNVNFTMCNMPTDIAEEIRNIYNNGVTWWKALWHMDGTIFVDDNPVGDYDYGPNSLRT